MRNRIAVLSGTWVIAAAIVLLLPSFAEAQAQSNNRAPRISSTIDENNVVTLRGNTHPLARAENDRGEAAGSLPTERMLLVLKRSPDQESALESLLEQQQDASSSNFHKWLTPQQFGQQFGPSDADIQTITEWLQSHGFQIGRVSNGRTVIEFSGNASQVQEAFHTAIHQYEVNGKLYWANSSDPQIPSALAPVVAGINTLYNFPRQAMHRLGGEFSRSKETGRPAPAASSSLFSFGGTCGVPGVACYGMGPYDFATIYNVTPLWNASPTRIDGTGQTIAVVGESDVNIQDIQNFRTIFGLAANDPHVIVDGTDPGTVPGDETESDLDLEWTGAVAKGANIDFVISQTTSTTLGVDLAAQYIVDNNVAPVLSESYGICELFLGSTGNQFFNQLWQQAAAQGITALVATGDSGSAVCDRNAGTDGPAQFGLSVSGFSSTPYNIAVGGTDFNDLTSPSTYWNPTNTVPPGAPAGTPATVSAKSYIPETTWNNTCTNAVFGNLLGYSPNPETNCNNPQLQGFGFDIADGSGSGGKSSCINGNGQTPSSCTQGYSKPPWQTALTPHDSARDVPDVSMMAAVGSPSGAFYLVCAVDITSGGFTSCQASDPNTHYIAIGGTSASTPVFAGIMALVNQATGSRQGNAANVLYKLAGQAGNSCNSSNGAGTNCVFYDTTNGTIAMPCTKGSPNCTVSTQGDSVGVLSGYATTAGYDLATGLGSVNANNLVTKWKNFSLTPSTTTLSLNSGAAINITHGQSVNVNIGVTGSGGPPTGNVSLIANTGPNGTEGVQGFTLSGGSATGTTNALPGGSNYTVVASYAGDGTFGSSTSSPPVAVNVAPEASKASVAYELFDPVTHQQTNANATTAVFGTPSTLRVSVTSVAGDACPNNAPGNFGCPTGNVALTDAYNGGAAAPLDGGSFPLNSAGYAEDEAIDLPGGTHHIAAAYPGDSSYTAAAPGSGTVTITPVATNTTLLFPGFSGIPGFVTGQEESINTSIAVPQPVFTAIAPTGTVTYFSGTTPIGTVQVLGRLDPNSHIATAVSTILTTNLPHGQDSLTAQYSGDASYSGSTSPAQIVSDLYQTSVAVSPSSPSIPHGTPVTLTATVTTTQAGAPPITGTVQFTAGSLQLGSATLSNGQAQITTSALPASSLGGIDVVEAAYGGDTNFVASTGFGDVNVSLLQTTTTLTTSNPSVLQGTSLTFTATVSATGNPANPPPLTGTVQFTYCFLDECGVTIGGPVTIAGGVAQVTTTALQANTNQVTATYSGDTNYAVSAMSIAETVNPPPDFQMTSTYNVVNVPGPGNSGTMILNVASVGGYSGTVNFTGCTGLPAESSCSFSPPSVTVSANMPNGSTTVTVITTAPSGVVPSGRRGPDGIPWRMVTIWVAGFLLLQTLLAAKRRRKSALALLALAVLLASVSCGGGGSGAGGGAGGGGGGGGGGNSNPGTPLGSDPNGVITATSGSITHTFSFGIDVESH